MATSSGDAPTRDGSGEMFDAIAERYDLLNRIISLGVDQRWRRRCVDALALDPDAPSTVLDLATGTADLAMMIAERWPRAKVLGTDPSARMLDVGLDKAARLNGRVELQQGDAMDIALEDDSVDATSIAFGIRNVPDRDRALREMARVTRPSGRVAILELADPKPGPLGALARVHVHHVVPTVGAWLSGKREYRYLAKSIAAFPPADAFAAQMEAAGLEVLEAAPMTFGACVLFVARPRGGAEA